MATIEKQKKTGLYQLLLAGIIAGIAEVVINHPLWVIKTRIQSDYKPILQLKGMYHGLFSNMLSMVPLIALRLTLATVINEKFDKKKANSQQLILSAFIGGGIPSILSSSLELIRTKQVNMKLPFLSTYKALVKKNGYIALLAGMPGTITRDGLYTCGFFALTPILKDKIQSHMSSENKWLSDIFSKPLAGAVAAFASQPLDTIKTRQQMNIGKKNNSFIKVTQNIVEKEGFYGFFKGATPRILRVTSAVTIISTVNEKIQSQF